MFEGKPYILDRGLKKVYPGDKIRITGHVTLYNIRGTATVDYDTKSGCMVFVMDQNRNHTDGGRIYNFSGVTKFNKLTSDC